MDMMEVVEYYYKTIDKQHPEGNMKEVADHFKITPICSSDSAPNVTEIMSIAMIIFLTILMFNK